MIEEPLVWTPDKIKESLTLAVGALLIDEPLVWTTKGNLPISALEYFHRWDDQVEYTKFTEGYTLNGEVVKESAHVYMRKTAGMELTQETL